jgi:hypothetical protein
MSVITKNVKRVWEMPNFRTFDIKAINELITRYVSECVIVIDPFNGNSTLATKEFTNDLNPDTSATYHLDALEFLKRLDSRCSVI